jgi:hypothetical protein
LVAVAAVDADAANVAYDAVVELPDNCAYPALVALVAEAADEADAANVE